MIFWLCGLLALSSAVTACLMEDMRRAVLSLWVCGLSVGGLYLALGAELLAVVQWILSTLIAIAFIFYAMMFGEYGRLRPEPEPAGEPWSARILRAVLPALAAAGFTAMIVFGASEISGNGLTEFGPNPAMNGAEIMANENLDVVGRMLAGNHFISMELLGLTLFLVIIGSGVVARPERLTSDQASSETQGGAS